MSAYWTVLSVLAVAYVAASAGLAACTGQLLSQRQGVSQRVLLRRFWLFFALSIAVLWVAVAVGTGRVTI